MFNALFIKFLIKHRYHLFLSLFVIGSIYCNSTQNTDTKNHVFDYAGILNSEQINKLNSLLSNYDHQTSVQIAIAIPTSLSGKTLENYSIELAKTWGIGQKGVNNGALIVVVPTERAIRIETGYGIEWPISDIEVQLIIQKMLPEFRKGNYFDGLLIGCNEIILRTAQLGWRVEFHSIKELEKNKEGCKGKIVYFKAKIIEESSDHIIVLANTSLNIKIEITKHMNNLVSILKKEKDKATIFARVIKSEPFVFQLLGVLSWSEH